MSGCCGFTGSFGGGGSGGGGGQRGGFMSPPEAWGQINVAANQNEVPLSALVSQSFDTVQMIRAGSIVGLSARLSTPILTGSLVAHITLNGVSVLFLACNAGTNPTGGVITQPIGVETYSPGGLIGAAVTTSVDFTPLTAELEVWVEVFESP